MTTISSNDFIFSIQAAAAFHEFSSDNLDELLVEYCTPSGVTPNDSLEEDEDEIVAPPYSPVSIPPLQNSPQQNTSTPMRTYTPQDSELSPHLETLSNPTTDVVCSVVNHNTSKWEGFVVVGDNIDKAVHVRHQTLKSRDRSLHFFLTVMQR